MNTKHQGEKFCDIFLSYDHETYHNVVPSPGSANPAADVHIRLITYRGRFINP